MKNARPLIPQEEVDSSVIPTVQILELVASRVLTHMATECQALSQDDSMPAKEIFDKAYAIADEVCEAVLPYTPCSQGCSHCCHMNVSCSRDDANRIAKHLGIKLPTPQEMYGQLLAEVFEEGFDKKYIGQDCPFLSESRCSIYSVRPLACRTHFNVSSYSEICDLTQYPQARMVPALSLAPLWKLVNSTALRTPDVLPGDIRVFFPDGKETPSA